MKKKLLLSVMLLAGWGLSAIAQNATTVRQTVSRDTWVQTNGGSANRGNNTSMEITRFESNGEIKNNYGLLGFDNLDIPYGAMIKKAVLHIVTERVKINPLFVYSYGHNFAEKDNWDVEGSYVTEALQGRSVQFTVNGQNGKAIFDGLGDEYQSLDKWENNVDVTSLFTDPYSGESINFLIGCSDDVKTTSDVRIFTKENTGIQNNNVTPEWAKEITTDQLVPYLEITYVEAGAFYTNNFACVADTWIRESDLNYSDPNGTSVEVNITNEGKYFAALFGFAFNVPAGMEVEKAELRLVTQRYKGGSIDVYGYPSDFAENATWGSESDNIAKAEESEPVINFTPKGQWNKDIELDAIDAASQNLESWTNVLNVTDYVKGLGEDASRVNFFLTHSSAQNKFYTRNSQGADVFPIKDEAGKDFDPKQFADHFSAEDVQPVLIVTFRNNNVEVPEKPEIFYGSDNSAQSEGDDKGNYDIWVDSQNDEVIIYFKAPEGSEVYYSYTKKALDSNAGTLMGVNVLKAAPAEGQETKANLSSWEDGYHELILPNNTAGTLSVRVVSPEADEQNYTYSYMAAKNDPTVVEEIEAAEAVAEYFTLQGVRVLNPERGQIYIKVLAGKASKLVF